MTAHAFSHLDAQLASILDHVQSLRHLDLAVETDRQLGLDVSRYLLGAIACFRHGLVHLGSSDASPFRRAA